MIGLILLVAAAVGWWAWKTRDAQAMRIGDVSAVVAALIGLRMLTRGEELTGILAFAGAGWWYWFRKQRPRALATRMTADEARRLLDLPPGASVSEVRAAHRRLVARVHPDVGGSADLTAQVNAARDALIGRS